MPQIDVYTADYCPYCTKAKNLLQMKGATFTEHDLSGDDAARAKLVEKANGSKTIPQIFIDDRHIGGYSDLEKLNNAGQLEGILKGES